MTYNPIFTGTYDLDYFTDSQMFLYIGDVWVDEVTSLQYVCHQTKTPIHGYASQLFDTTAAGHVLVQGSFSINFKEQGYLWAVLRRFFDMGPGAPQFTEKGLEDPIDAAKAKKLVNKRTWAEQTERPIIGSNGTQVSRASIERIAQGEATKGERYKFYQDLAAYSTFSVDSPKDKVFEDIVEAFEDEIWKTSSNANLINQIRRMDDNAFDGFDIYAVFGNYENPKLNHTCSKIVDVRLLSQGKSIQVGQGAIQEEYTFIAKTVV